MAAAPAGLAEFEFEFEFERLFHLEIPTLEEVDMNSKGDSYKNDRKIAINYLANLRVKKLKESVREYYEAAYMAVNLFDRLYGKIANVIEPSEDNTSLFLTCCFTLSWKILKSEDDLLRPYTQKLLYKGSNLEGLPLEFTEVNVKQMESNMMKHLEPPLQQVMPFAYIPLLTQLAHAYLRTLDKCYQPLYRLIWKSLGEIEFEKQFRSSVLAVAAFLVFISKEYASESKAFESFVLKLDLIKPLSVDIKDCKMKMARRYDELAETEEELETCLPDVVNLMLGLGQQAASERFCTCCRIQ